ncbi:protein-tyrosine phosphatase domain-containing protein [Ditylenchus destructor]|uniref:protein-tyrosine-phosphatase n=1 Tax=Ditylenchus destructor TaxID=166010 RepID=A0AAD4MK71_9BILA|nr:protein-tyrosine phosphatase domain-containing protein [Ditylenchus destructor]
MKRIEDLCNNKDASKKIKDEFEAIPYHGEENFPKKLVPLTSITKATDRYEKVRPFTDENDKNRIKLQNHPNDYVNDQFQIKRWHNDKHPVKFVATQGPTAASIELLWKAVFQEGISIIVMLTNTTECKVDKEGKTKVCEKCNEYWPTVKVDGKYRLKYILKYKDEDETELEVLMHASTEICSMKQQDKPSYGHVRKFTLTGKKQGVVVTHEVTQYHFLDWKDHSAPDPGEEEKVRVFMQDIRKDAQKVLKKFPHNIPIIAHCAAGIGRTGTFFLIFVMILQVEANAKVDPQEITKVMREQRMNMIHVSEQYEYSLKFVLTEFHDGRIKPLVDSTVSNQKKWNEMEDQNETFVTKMFNLPSFSQCLVM